MMYGVLTGKLGRVKAKNIMYSLVKEKSTVFTFSTIGESKAVGGGLRPPPYEGKLLNVYAFFLQKWHNSVNSGKSWIRY